MASVKTEKAKANGRTTSVSDKPKPEGESPPDKELPKAARATKGAADAAALLKMVTGDSIRLNVLFRLLDGAQTVAELGEVLGASESTIVRHVGLLRRGGLVQVRRLGKRSLPCLTKRGQIHARCLAEIVRETSPRRRPSPRDSTIDKSLLHDVGGFVDNPEEWFHTPNLELGGLRPVDMLGTDQEPRLRNRIHAAKLGMFS